MASAHGSDSSKRKHLRHPDKVTYILGAGFSRPAGFPLLRGIDKDKRLKPSGMRRVEDGALQTLADDLGRCWQEMALREARSIRGLWEFVDNRR